MSKRGASERESTEETEGLRERERGGATETHRGSEREGGGATERESRGEEIESLTCDSVKRGIRSSWLIFDLDLASLSFFCK